MNEDVVTLHRFTPEPLTTYRVTDIAKGTTGIIYAIIEEDI